MTTGYQRRANHPKLRVRTGCLTCKIRRIKCDESRPNCQRCELTGRKCDGYVSKDTRGHGVALDDTDPSIASFSHGDKSYSYQSTSGSATVAETLKQTAPKRAGLDGNFAYHPDPGATYSIGDAEDFVRTICAKDGATDPFRCTSLRVDPDAFDLVQFYIWWGTPYRLRTWTGTDRQVLETRGNPYRFDPVPILQDAFCDEVHMLSLCAWTSALSHHMGFRNPGSRRPIEVSLAAGKALQARLQLPDINKVNLLYDIAFLGIAAVFGKDASAAFVHLKAVRTIVALVGGLSMVPPDVVARIAFLNKRLAISTLTPPILSLPTEVDHPPFEETTHTIMHHESETRETFLSVLDIDLTVRKTVQDVIQCAKILQKSNSNSETMPDAIPNKYWVVSKCDEIRTSILQNFENSQNSQFPHLRRTVSWVSLLLWTTLLMATTIRKGKMRLFLPSFSCLAFVNHPSKTRQELQAALFEWNDALDQKRGDEEQLLSRMIQAVRKLEVSGEVQLGSYMQDSISSMSENREEED